MNTSNLFPIIAASVLSCTVLPSPSRAAEKDDVLVLSFFRDNGQAGIFLAASEDGLRFTPLNEDNPVMKPAPWKGQGLTRDPSIVFHDGKFHAVWTSSWSGDCFGYAESPDLVTWSEPVQVKPFPEGLSAEERPGNVWAPEICWDPIQMDYAIFWASTVKSVPGGHRIYITRTTDGKTFTAAKRFFDQNFNVIDGMMVFDDCGAADPKAGRWVMVVKNESGIPEGGKNLRLTFAPADFSQPWEPAGNPIAGPGSSVCPNEMAEGPSLLKWKKGWLLYWDAFANGHYSMASSPDLKIWTDRTSELQMPPRLRHGTVFRAPRAAVGWLKKAAATKAP